MSLLLTILAAGTFICWTLVVLELGLGSRRIRHLRRVEPLGDDAAPGVSAVIPACNEERNIEHALRSVLALDYPDLELIVIDDRSTDATGAILDRLAAAHPRLRVIHIHELPAGWLGKNHALAHGASLARGELLLFADADVVMDPTVLRRAVAHMRAEQLDHLTLMPDVPMPGTLLKMFAGLFAICLSLYARPWRARNPRSRFHIGIGAFNLVRAEAYRAAGTHQAIAMRPDDDMKLGKLLKKHGFRQEMLSATGLLSVEWYASVRELIDGLMKNMFAGVDYRIANIAGVTVLMLLGNVWPFVAVVCVGGAALWFNLATIALILGLFAGAARHTHGSAWHGLGFPVVSALFLYIIWRATWLTLRNDGIRWRGTHYPLAELKANRV